MPFHGADVPHEIPDSEFEHQLARLRSAVLNPVVGVFGPATLMWRVNREAAIFLGAGRALLLQLAHPWIATAISDHSRTLSDPVGRFHRTFNVVFTMVFGTLDQALAAARHLYHRHTTIRGVLASALGTFDAGSAYYANEVAALRWVFATLVDTAIQTHDLVLPPLTPQELGRYYAENQRFAALFGIPSAALPPDWPAFSHYVDEMLASDVLAVGSAARSISEALFGAIHAPAPLIGLYRAIAAGLLPERLREEFGFRYGTGEERRARRALAWFRRIYPLLPDGLRHVGPYQEACARLAGRARLGAGTRALNRLWIGKDRMTAGAASPANTAMSVRSPAP